MNIRQIDKELNLQEYIKVKCIRNVPPKQNTQNIPLQGIYNSLDNLEDPVNFPLENKFKNFDLSTEDTNSLDNLFEVSTKFGKLLLMENLDAFLILVNQSSNQEIEIRDLEVSLTNEKLDKDREYDINYQSVEIKIKTPQGTIKIKPKEFFIVHMKSLLTIISKYVININCYYNIKEFDEIYSKEKNAINNMQNPSVIQRIKMRTDKYYIEMNKVYKKFNKKLSFELNPPFKITQKFHNNQMKTCEIECNISNTSSLPLVINDITLYPIKNKNIKFKCMKCQKMKNILLEIFDKYSVVFHIDKKEVYLNYGEFCLEITWCTMFDFAPKSFQVVIPNALDIYSNFYNLDVVEKPGDVIVQNQNFKIIFQIENKVNQNIKIGIYSGKYNEKDRINDKKFDIIDIVEDNFSIGPKEKMNFCIICKSDLLGMVALPNLTFEVEIEGQQKNVKNYEKLLYFNCVKEINLI